MHRPLDPRIVNVTLDANAFDRQGGPEDAQVDRLLELWNSEQIRLVVPASVRTETLNPRTPASIRDLILQQIHTLTVEQSPGERDLYLRVREILQGNATPGKHDSDARHVVEAAKYGGYFITHDRRIHVTKRDELEAILPTSFWIVTLAEFLQIYDQYTEARHEK